MLSPEEVTDLAGRLLAEGGTWSFGVQGAVAELHFRGQAYSALRAGPRSVLAVGEQGGLRFDVPDGADVTELADGTLVFSVPAGPSSPRAGLSVEPGDAGALRPVDGDVWLADLGLGRPACRFCVRTADPALAEALSACAGLHWDDVLDRLGHRLVAESPHRVVITGVGRAEVYSPIPAVGGASPPGPHTHLLPERLRREEDLPAGVTLGPGRALGALYHPQAPGPKRRSPASPRPGTM